MSDVLNRIEKLAGKMDAPPGASPAQVEAQAQFVDEIGDEIPGFSIRGEGPPGTQMARDRSLGLFQEISGGVERERLADLDIDPSGGPFMPRLLASLPTDAQDKVISLEKNLAEYHGAPVTLRWDADANAVVYDIDPVGEEDAGNVKTIVLDAPGMDVGDIADVAGEVPAIAGEAAGLFASMRGFGAPAFGKLKRAGRYLRHLIMAGGGAAGGESVRIATADLTGAYPDPDRFSSELKTEPAKTAALTTAITTGMGVGGQIVKSVSNLVNKRALPPQYLEYAREKVSSNAAEAMERINAKLAEAGRPERLDLTSGELKNLPEVMSQEGKMAQQADLGGFARTAEVRGRQGEALTAAAEEARREVTPRPDRGFLGTAEAVREPFETALGGQEVQSAARIAAREKQVQRNLQQASSQADISPLDVGPTIRDVLGQKKKEISEWAKSVDGYGRINQVTEEMGLTGPATPLIKEAQQQAQTLSRDLVPSLSQENAQTVNQLLQSTEAGPVSYSQISRLISQLKTLERAANDGTMPGVDAAALSRLRQAAVSSRNEMTDSVPGLTDEIARVDTLYREKRQALQARTVDSIMKKFQGAYRVPDEKVFDKLFQKNGTTAAQEFMSIIDDPLYASQLRDFQKSILRKYVDTVAPDGKVSSRLHDKFMNDYSRVLDIYFKGNTGIFREGSRVVAALKAEIARDEQLAKTLNKEFGQQIRKWNVDTITDKLFRNPGTVESVKEALKQVNAYDRVWPGVQAHLLKRLEKSWTTRKMPGTSDRTISGASLDTFLHDAQGRNRDLILAIGGPKYLNNLEIIRDAAVQAQKGDAFLNFSRSGVASNEWISTILGEALRLKWGPLDKRSRWTGRLMGFRSAAEADNAARVMLNPQELDRLVSQMQMSPNSILAQQTIASIISKIAVSDDIDTEVGAPTTLNELQGMLNRRNRIRVQDAVNMSIDQR